MHCNKLRLIGIAVLVYFCIFLFPIVFTSAIHFTASAPDPVDDMLVVKTRLIVVLKPTSLINDGLINTLLGLVGGTLIHSYDDALNGLAISIPDPTSYDAAVLSLLANPDVDCVVPDSRARVHGHVSQTQPIQMGELAPTGVRRIQAASNSAVASTPPASVAIAVIDTGIDFTHPDLSSAVQGTNCVTPGTIALDDNGHGSAVSGVIAAANNGQGIVGIAPSTALYAVKVADSHGYAWNSDVICGINWTKKNALKYNITVAQMSIGFSGLASTPCGLDPLHIAVKALTKRTIMVVSAGNNHQPIATATPASYPEVLCATAITDLDGLPGGLASPLSAATCSPGDLDDTVASYSNFVLPGTQQTNNVIAAPGTCIYSTYLMSVSPYITLSGTSFAAPHVSAVVALCIANGQCAGKTASQIISIVINAANTNPQLPGYAYTGANVAEYYGPLLWANAF